jgi:hypothetical protein
VKRRTVAIDRLTCGLVGAAVTAAGLLTAGWAHGDLHVPAGSRLTIVNLDNVLSAPWWPFALGALAVILIVVGLRWLFSHRPGQTVGTTAVPGSSTAGTLTVDLDTAASAAAAALGQHPLIETASGTALLDRGQHVLELDVKVEPGPTALVAIDTVLEDTRRDLGLALDGVGFTTRILVRTARKPRGAARVT